MLMRTPGPLDDGFSMIGVILMGTAVIKGIKGINSKRSSNTSTAIVRNDKNSNHDSK